MIYFPIGTRNGQLSLEADIELSVDMTAGLEDRGDSTLITNLAKDRLESSIARILNSNRAVVQEINGVLAQLGSFLVGDYVVDVTMDGDSLVITYR